MASQIPEITESNHDTIECYLEHLLTDLHEALRMLRDQGKLLARHDALLTEFEPLLAQFRTPAASMLARRAARRGSNGRD